MQIQDWPIADVRPYPNNPRVLRNAAEKVADSIKAFGWRQPIVVDEQGVVIIGHSRLAAAKLLKLSTVPVHVAAGLSEAQARALRVADSPDVRFRWYCLPIQHRNACSRKVPYWHPWHPDDRAKWVRELPAQAITSAPWFSMGMTMPDCAPHVFGPEHGTVADIRGIRAQESMRRLRLVSMREQDNWIAGARNGHNSACSPIYDWTSEDVWLAPRRFGWDYNRAYDVFDKAGVTMHDQRVCPPYGEEPLGGLYRYALCWPELWHKMLARVPGAATAARYARTELYGFGTLELPPGKTWRTWFEDVVAMWPPEQRQVIRGNVAEMIRLHNRKTRGRDIPDEVYDPVSGASWKFFCLVAIRGDLKNRRKGGMQLKGDQTRRKMGITLEEARAQVEGEV